jgi:hypothetical protein
MKKLLFTLSLLLLPLLASADPVEIDGVYYVLIKKNKQAKVTKNPNDYKGDVVIPETVDYEGESYNVIEIEQSAFAHYNSDDYDLKSVTLPNSIKHLPHALFIGRASLTNVNLPKNLISISDSVFYDCKSLESITIPESVNMIEGSAFYNCRSLKSVFITNLKSWCNIYFTRSFSNPLSYAHRLILNDKEIVDLVIPKEIKEVKDYTFDGCDIETVTFHDAIERIGSRAFNNCKNLKSVELPLSIKTIGTYAFYGCINLCNINIPPLVDEISDYTFSNCSGLISINFSSNIKIIGMNAFEKCSSLNKIDLPTNLQIIKGGAFYDCSGFNYLTIPDKVERIESIAFWNCSEISTINIGKKVKYIEARSFGNCKEITDVYCYAINVPNTISNAFENSYIDIATLHVPTESISTYKTTEPWSSFGKIVGFDGGEMPDPETKICATPTISYQFGQLSFSSETEGVTFVSEITDYDIKKSYDASLYLTATYYISVYATKDGYEDSDVATATLSWMDAELETDISGGIANVRAKPVLIQSNGNTVSISGVDEGTPISIYDVSGKMVGSAKAASENTFISTSLNPGDVGLVKIGDKTIKIIMK